MRPSIRRRRDRRGRFALLGWAEDDLDWTYDDDDKDDSEEAEPEPTEEPD